MPIIPFVTWAVDGTVAHLRAALESGPPAARVLEISPALQARKKNQARKENSVTSIC